MLPALDPGCQPTTVEALWQAFRQTGDAAARERLVEHYREYARIIAARAFARRRHADIEFRDLLHWAYVGLIESVDRFNPAQGARFETFAARRVLGALLDGIEQATEIEQQLGARRRRLAQRVGSLDPAVEGGPAKDVFVRIAELAVGLAVGFALETAWTEGDDGVGVDLSYDSVAIKQLRQRVVDLVPRLPARQQQVIRAHYLHDMPFVEVAKQLGLTKGRVSQLHKEAILGLRRMMKETGAIDVCA